MNCLFKLLFFASNILFWSFVDGCQTLNITCEGDKTQVYSEVYDGVMTRKIWYNFTAARKKILLLNIKHGNKKKYTNQIAITLGKKVNTVLYPFWEAFHNQPLFMFLLLIKLILPLSDPYFYCCIDPSLLGLFIIFLDDESHGRRT